MTKWCSGCQAEREGKFCQECGQELQNKHMVCSCGSAFPPDAKFCPECGKKVEQAGEQIKPEKGVDPLICLHCNSLQEDENWKFCMVCGEQRSDAAEQSTVQNQDIQTENAFTKKQEEYCTPQKCFRKGKSFEFGKGVPKNDDEAQHWYEKAAQEGLPEAMFRLAVVLGRKGEITESKHWAYQGSEKKHLMSLIFHSYYNLILDETVNFDWNGLHGDLFIKDINVDFNIMQKLRERLYISETIERGEIILIRKNKKNDNSSYCITNKNKLYPIKFFNSSSQFNLDNKSEQIIFNALNIWPYSIDYSSIRELIHNIKRCHNDD